MATSSQNAAMAADLSMAVQAGTDTISMIAGAISAVNDQNKRRAFEQNFAVLNLDQQEKLATLLMDANSETERLAILTKALASNNVQRISNIATMYAEQEKKKRNQKLIIGGGIILVGLIAVVIMIKKT